MAVRVASCTGIRRQDAPASRLAAARLVMVCHSQLELLWGHERGARQVEHSCLWETENFKTWWATVEGMLDGEIRRTSTMRPVFPSDQGLERQKVGLLDW